MAGDAPLTAQIVSTGTMPAMLFHQIDETAICSGLVSDNPDYVFELKGQPAHLGIFFESEQDASLVVVNKARHCKR
ncbi:MAG: hypothetical protein IPK16_19745 [Anaerolineales bacterium]|nr:hypothetical protein [Anaerolineales bacterium]